MRKVLTVSLHGRSYKIEEQGYQELQAYLEHAEQTLADNPDKAEIMADIEQAIADKCQSGLHGSRDVIAAEQLHEVLQQIGAVEDEGAPAAADSAGARLKRLYLVREGAVLLGVCNGLGLYFGIDPVLVRVAFILLTILTGGVWILIYLLLGLFLPTADATQQAAAAGKPLTAQAIIARAKQRTNQESLRQLEKGGRIVLRIIGNLAATIFSVLTAAWVWLLWLLALGKLRLYGSAQPINGWRELAIITTAYLVLALPALLIFRGFDRRADGRAVPTKTGAAVDAGLSIVWGLTIVAFCLLGSLYGHDLVNDAHSHHGYLRVGNSQFCLDHSTCGTQSRH